MRQLSKLELLTPVTPEAQIAVMRDRVKAGAADRPGVYRMIAAGGEVVYVGKSKRLRSRLLSYFRADYPGDKGARILREGGMNDAVERQHGGECNDEDRKLVREAGFLAHGQVTWIPNVTWWTSP